MGTENITNNDNSEQTDATTLRLAHLIDKHNATRLTIARLRTTYDHSKANPVNSDLVGKRLERAIKAEQLARDELLLFPVKTVQQAATKAVHLRSVLLQDEAENPTNAADEQTGILGTCNFIE